MKLLDGQGPPWWVVKEARPQPVPQFPLIATDMTAEPQACSCVINDTNVAPVWGDPAVIDTGLEGGRYFHNSRLAVQAEAKG